MADKDKYAVYHDYNHACNNARSAIKHTNYIHVHINCL